jgi:hypothetical protein
MLEYVHFVPGRLRLKNSKLRNQRGAAQAEAYALTIPVVKNAVANPLTGSLTIIFEDGASAIDDLWCCLCAQGYASGPCPVPATSRSAPLDDLGGKGLERVVVTAIVEAIVSRSAQALVRALL